MFEAQQVLAKITGVQLRAEAKLILFSKKEVLLTRTDSGLEFPEVRQLREILSENTPLLQVGALDGIPCFGAELNNLPESLPEGVLRNPSRSVLANCANDFWTALCRTRELVFWRKQHQFCGACRSVLTPSATDLALICPDCGMRYYPQIAPAVIVAISRNNRSELLLAHNRNFESNIYGLIAGFIESGETAEQAVSREIAEETGIQVKNIRYLTSQTWPFPNSLMLAFSAEYAGGEAKADGTELTDLGWFTAGHLPELPHTGSIARAIINQFFHLESGC